MIKWAFILIPFAKRNVVYNTKPYESIGYSDYYIFGVRVARIQKTTPWD